MSPVYFGSTKVNTLYVGNTKINKAYVGNTLVYSSEFIGTVTIVTIVTYAGETIVDTSCIPNGATIAMVAQISGTATDATFAWTRPAGSSAPVAGLTTGTLTWTAVAGDGGTYGVTVSSRNSSDSPKSTLETINIFGYTPPAFTDADANQWITRVELSDCGALEPGVRAAMNQLVGDLKTSGFFGDSPVIHPLIGARNARALVPLKSPGYEIFTSNYDRQLGLRQTSTSGVPVTVRHNLDLSSRINAGSAGVAIYTTSFSTNTTPANINFFNNGSGSDNELTMILTYTNQYSPQTPVFFWNYAGFVATPASTDGVTPAFVAMQRTGALAQTVVKSRVNSILDTKQPTSHPIARPIIDLALVPPNNTGGLGSSHRIDYAFLVAGGGASDYTSTALRTIIETYVAAIQAAIPG
jgi:hypothetical protein